MPHKLTDVGTRYQFYRELLDLWEDGLDLTKNRSLSIPNSKVKQTQLENSIWLLRTHIDMLAYFVNTSYSDSNRTIKKLIDTLPPADEIKGGRGTQRGRCRG